MIWPLLHMLMLQAADSQSSELAVALDGLHEAAAARDMLQGQLQAAEKQAARAQADAQVCELELWC